MSFMNVVALLWVLYWPFKMMHDVVMLESDVDSAYSVNYSYFNNMQTELVYLCK